MERRGWVTRVGIDLVNWQQEEPTGFGGRRQLSMGGTSRVSREAQARICERLGVQFPGPTRRVFPSFSPWRARFFWCFVDRDLFCSRDCHRHPASCYAARLPCHYSPIDKKRPVWFRFFRLVSVFLAGDGEGIGRESAVLISETIPLRMAA